MKILKAGKPLRQEADVQSFYAGDSAYELTFRAKDSEDDESVIVQRRTRFSRRDVTVIGVRKLADVEPAPEVSDDDSGEGGDSNDEQGKE